MNKWEENKTVDTELFSKWYNEIVYGAKLVDQAPVRGCAIIRPYGYKIWEIIRNELDLRIQKTGTENAYFPLFIPESFLNKEKEHVEGFSPELAVVTHAGGNKLEEPLVVRPTSETIVYNSFARWLKSYRDLPLKINQWANVVRWEKRTRPFLRTSEFLWQEGHTVHLTEKEALEMSLEALTLYVKFLKEFLAIPVIAGEKTESERFAGAKKTFTMEAMMRDGKALQLGTSHLLSHSFPKSFGVAVQGETGEMITPWCTSWGVTTRMIGALIMTHGDEKGLVLPPKVAPIQVAIIPIIKSGFNVDLINKFVAETASKLESAGLRIEILDDPDKSPGSKFFECEYRGIPYRLEVGPKDVEKNAVMVVPRLRFEPDVIKESVPVEKIVQYLTEKMDLFQIKLYDRAQEFSDTNNFQAESLDEVGKKLERGLGFFTVAWCQNKDCEERLKSIKATSRVVLNNKLTGRKCFVCTKGASSEIIVAKAY